MLQDTLKSATKAHHDELEALMFVHEIMNKTLTLDQYKTLLATNYIVHSAMESKLHQALDASVRTDLNIEKRDKLTALELDLEEMGMNKAELDKLAVDLLPVPENNNAAALGAMYVLEGATLGGHVIQKKLRANPAFEQLNLNYYSVYAQDLMPNWLSFVHTLNTSVAEQDFPEAEQSAVGMFNHIASISRSVKAVI